MYGSRGEMFVVFVRDSVPAQTTIAEAMALEHILDPRIKEALDALAVASPR